MTLVAAPITPFVLALSIFEVVYVSTVLFVLFDPPTREAPDEAQQLGQVVSARLTNLQPPGKLKVTSLFVRRIGNG
jgi:hypothetical protein